ncbi:glycoside hydrolase family 32 protein [Terriglobus saanensis]|uniref:beta-fructofuranosidase n=1 Tax=Terriglobus saanensis (strain ATCC BAA-1853 / DSM 23119 / SP1PR4) TaxID=401053 RepID=E8UXS7_TERSS|nr:glycoside hydrolase family 32 protein [Terriglobus saanensis]ADV83093.1 Glycosyl hydrolase family 32 domain protein [Terriglobus saanensis SP1PR4]
MKTNVTRREFLRTVTIACLPAASPLAALVSGAPPEFPTASRLSKDPRRPQFHLLPTHNWMNDPNGPIYFAGKYHIFFQYNPEAAIWGNMSWNHAISDDMLHWKNYPVAFTMTPGGADAAGCFSGSAILADHEGKPRVCAIYTGVVKDKDHETVRNEGLRESQCLAWSEDPMLMQWTKVSKPVIPHPPDGLAITGFRDPSIWKQGDDYFLMVGSGMEKVGGCVLLYRSKDLLNWKYLHPLVSGVWNGAYTRNPVGDGEMWECPDFFPLDGGHVLIYSSMGKVIWQSGVLNQTTMRFEPKKSGLLDLDAFYAPKTQLDAHGRRILWGWIPERRSQAEMIEAGWSGMMSLPRVLSLDRDGTLRMEVLPDAINLRDESIPRKQTEPSLSVVLADATGEFLCTGKRDTDMRLSVMSGSVALVEMEYSSKRHAWLVEGKSIVLQPSDTPSLHGFVDGSVIEVILSERVGYTKRFYYPSVTAPDITIQVSGAVHTLNGWKISPISDDRLSTDTALT